MSVQIEEEWRYKKVRSERTSRSALAYKIIANISPPFINFIFKKLQTDLRRYGIATPIDLFVVEAIEGQPQIILDCIKFGNNQES